MSSAGLPILAGTKPPWLLVASKSSDCSSYLPSAPHRVQTPRAANGINSISSSALSLGWKAYPSRSLLPVRAKGFDGETPIGEDHQSQSEDLKPTSVQSNPGSQNFLTFLCPLLKLLGVSGTNVDQRWTYHFWPSGLAGFHGAASSIPTPLAPFIELKWKFSVNRSTDSNTDAALSGWRSSGPPKCLSGGTGSLKHSIYLQY